MKNWGNRRQIYLFPLVLIQFTHSRSLSLEPGLIAQTMTTIKTTPTTRIAPQEIIGVGPILGSQKPENQPENA